MVNAGFNVKEVKLRGDVFVKEETGELLLSREIKEIAQSHHANDVLVGTLFGRSHGDLCKPEVRTHLEMGRIVRGHDYALPNDKDITKLLQVVPARQ